MVKFKKNQYINIQIVIRMFWIFKISYKFHKIYLNIIRNRIFNDYLFLLKEIFIDPGTIIIINEIKIIKNIKKLMISILI